MLTGTYPNPGVDKQKVGGLLAVQRIFGSNPAYATIVNGQKFFCNAAKTVPLQVAYTPPVDCWWETELLVGIMNKTDAAYHPAFVNIYCTPADADGRTQVWMTETQHSTVQTYCFKHITALWRLTANVAYTAYSWFSQLATAGTWQYHQQDSTLSMQGRAWAL